MKPPDYTVKDLVYYSGLFLGIIGAYLLLAPLGAHPVLRLVVGLLAGVGLGWGFERIYRSIDSTRPPDDDRDRP